MLYSVENENIQVTANSLGAELFSVRNKKKDDLEYIWRGEKPYWTSRAINIFPVCGRLFGGGYAYEGKRYELGCHGFAHNSEFVLDPSSDGSTLVFALESDEKTKKSYPFDFKLKICFSLRGDTLTWRYIVKNEGSEILPFALGGHPGFNVPLDKGKKFEDYRIDFGETGVLSKFALSDACFITGVLEDYFPEDGRYIPLRHELFDGDALLFVNKSGRVTLESASGGSSVTVSCPLAEYVGLWHDAKTDAPFVCIEPWTGLPGTEGVAADIMRRNDLFRLAPGGEHIFEFQIKFD